MASQDRINAAYAYCNAKGTLLTVKHLTNLPINYLITVNFHGFKEIVDKIGGVWMDVDRRYYNGTLARRTTNYANINLQPGYQLLTGEQALDFVRFRHTDDDSTGLRASRSSSSRSGSRFAKSISLTQLPSLVSTITKNVEVGEGGRSTPGQPGDPVRALRGVAAAGHFFQDRIENVTGTATTCTASTDDIQAAVNQFTHPDVQTSKAANAAALGRKVKSSVLPPSKVTLTVLNGNGVPGSAADTSYLLAPARLPDAAAAAPAQGRMRRRAYFHTKIYYDPAQKGSQGAANALAKLFVPADVASAAEGPPALRALDPGVDAARRRRRDVPQRARPAGARRASRRRTSRRSCAPTPAYGLAAARAARSPG